VCAGAACSLPGRDGHGGHGGHGGYGFGVACGAQVTSAASSSPVSR
jgi:hypothetical protein